MDTRQAKRQLRKQARERRRDLACAARAAGEAVAERLAPLVLAETSGVVAGYSAIGDELDPGALLRRLDAAGRSLALPRVEQSQRPLGFRRWRPGDPLRRGPYGVMEPTGEAEPVRPGVLLVPLLCFDRAGYRLGYGGGYYDRSIAAFAQTNTRPVLIGLAYAGQEVDAVPRSAHDAAMDMIATEAEILRIGQGRGEERGR